MSEPAPAPVGPPRAESGLRRFLFGCLIGCGGLSLLVVGSCVGFVVWLGRPGPLLEPHRLIDPQTGAYVEWNLRLEDPGTARLVERTLEQLNRMQTSQAPIPLLARWQQRRNERQMRELFPFVVAWSLRPAATAGEYDHLFSLSVERLGNRLVLADWVLGWILGRSPEVELVDHRGERIYRVREGYAFFLRRSDFFFTTDVPTAQRAVELLERAEGDDAGELAGMLAQLPPDRPLRGAAVNDHGEAATVLGWLVGPARSEPLAAWGWESVRGLTLAGGFTEESSFEALLTVRVDDPEWAARHADELAAALASGLGVGDALPVEVSGEARPEALALRIAIADLPGLLEEKLGRLAEGQLAVD